MTKGNLQTISLSNKTLKDYELIRASEIEPKEISWLWYPFIPSALLEQIGGEIDRYRTRIEQERGSEIHGRK